MYIFTNINKIMEFKIKELLKRALTDDINDKEVYMKSIDASYNYAGYNIYKSEKLK